MGAQTAKTLSPYVVEASGDSLRELSSKSSTSKSCSKNVERMIQGQSIKVKNVRKPYRKHNKSTREFTCLGKNLMKNGKKLAIKCNNGTWESKSGKKVCKEKRKTTTK